MSCLEESKGRLRSVLLDTECVHTCMSQTLVCVCAHALNMCRTPALLLHGAAMVAESHKKLAGIDDVFDDIGDWFSGVGNSIRRRILQVWTHQFLSASDCWHSHPCCACAACRGLPRQVAQVQLAWRLLGLGCCAAS